MGPDTDCGDYCGDMCPGSGSGAATDAPTGTGADMNRQSCDDCDEQDDACWEICALPEAPANEPTTTPSDF